MCHHKAPHRPWEPDDKHASMYEDVDIPTPETFDDNDSGYATRSDAAREATMRIDKNLTRTDLKQDPPAGLSGEALKKWKYERFIKDYLRCVASVDDSVGRLLKYLDDEGLAKNTIVIYTSDQGFFLGDHDWFDKRFMYEESLRMPFLVRYPGVVKPESQNNDMILNVDFAPTFLACAGLPVPKEVQGRSILPLLERSTPKDWRTSMYYRYYHYPADHRVQPHYGVRTERYKLIYFNRIDQWEFYDLEKDPHELHNVYTDPKYAKNVKELTDEMTRLRTELNDHNQFQDQQK
jgi:arylsulfatase A-like enzyme